MRQALTEPGDRPLGMGAEASGTGPRRSERTGMETATHRGKERGWKHRDGWVSEDARFLALLPLSRYRPVRRTNGPQISPIPQ